MNVDTLIPLELGTEVDFMVESLWEGDREALRKENGHVISPANFFAPVYHLLGPLTGPLHGGIWLAGGAVVRWLEGEKVNAADFDIFSSDVDEAKRRVEAAGFQALRDSFLSTTFENRNDVRVQVIKRAYPSLLDVLNSFDFRARMVGTDGNLLYAHPKAQEDISRRQLVQHQGDFSLTVTSLFGLAKYANRGYTLSHSQARNFLKAWGSPAASQPGY